MPEKIFAQSSYGKSVNQLLTKLDTLTGANVGQAQLEAALEEAETSYYMSQDVRILPYLSFLCYKVGIPHLAKHYYSLSSRISNLADKQFRLGALLYPASSRITEVQSSDTKFEKYDLRQEYTYQGNRYSYSILSFSEDIGKNLTLLKTRHGTIIFDCGAKAGSAQEDIISEEELRSFLNGCQVSIQDIQVVLISHAHLDHYGSISSLINLGVKPSHIYMNAMTKQLISCVANQKIPYPEKLAIRPFMPGGVKITPFHNGHILGSEGYVITFDGLNIVYTGDYCLHTQQTVPGLRSEDILSLEPIKKYGIECVITETTYGKKSNELSYGEMHQVFNHVVKKLIECRYKVFIPSFAIGRSQEIALLLNSSFRILIAGLAAEISRIYEKFIEQSVYNANVRFAVNKLSVRDFDSCDVILASSGMLANGSTSAHYLETILNSEVRTAVIRTGYLSSESYGKVLLDQWKDSGKFFVDIPLSAHADLSEINSLLSELAPKNVVMIHGDGLALAQDTKKTFGTNSDSKAQQPPTSLPPEQPSTEPCEPTVISTEESASQETVPYILQDDDVDKVLRSLLVNLFDYLPNDIHINPVDIRQESAFVEVFQWLRLYPRYHFIINQIHNRFANSEAVYKIISSLKNQLEAKSEMNSLVVSESADVIKPFMSESVESDDLDVTYHMIAGTRFRHVHSKHTQHILCSACDQIVCTTDYAEFDLGGQKNIICGNCYAELQQY